MNTQTERLLLKPTPESVNIYRSSLHGQNSQPAVDQLSPAFQRDSAAQRWQPLVIQRSTSVILGIALIITSVPSVVQFNTAPQYEGKFQIVLESDAALDGAIALSRSRELDQSSAASAINYDAQIKVFESPRVIDPIVDKLRIHGLETNYELLTNNLSITYQKQTGALEVYYRDTDPQRVQLILEQVAYAYLQEGLACQTDSCRGLHFIDSQLPTTEQHIADLELELQTLQQQYGFTNPSEQRQLLLLHITEIAKQEADIQIELTSVGDRHQALYRQLALQPQAELALNALNHDQTYRALLKQLHQLESQITAEFSHAQTDKNKLQIAYSQHHALLIQLRHHAQRIIIQGLFENADDEQALALQSQTSLNILQEWIDTASYLQALEIRQQTIATIKSNLNQRLEQWAVLSQRYNDVQQELQLTQSNLNQYHHKRRQLQAEVATQEISWQLVAPPEIIHNR